MVRSTHSQALHFGSVRPRGQFLAWIRILPAIAILAASRLCMGELFRIDSPNRDGNAAAYHYWLASIGLNEDEIAFTIDFEIGFTHRQIVAGRLGLFPGGLVVDNADHSAQVRCGSDAIGGSHPIGNCALFSNERAYTTLNFSQRPVNYLAFQDIDQGDTTVRIHLTDGTLRQFSPDATSPGGHSAEFLGMWTTEDTRIALVEMDAGGGGGWGLDNIRFGRIGDGVSPIARPAGPYHFDAGHLTVHLDGSASYDPDGTFGDMQDLVEFRWDLGGDGLEDDEDHIGPHITVALDEAVAKGLSITTPLSLFLQVEDLDGLSGRGATTIEYESTAPSVDAGGPYGLLGPGGTLRLEGQVDDIDLPMGIGEQLRVEWDTSAATSLSEIGDGFATTLAAEVAYETLLARAMESNIALCCNARDNAGLVSSDCSTATLKIPDLQVTRITTPAEGVAGQEFEVEWTVRNLGTAPAVGPWQDRTYFTRDPQHPRRQLLIEQQFDGVLQPGQAYSNEARVRYPAIADTYWIAAETDVLADVRELEYEDNNLRVDDEPITLESSPLPDLIVETVIPPANGVLSGRTATISFIVRNVGSGPTYPTQWLDTILFSVDPNLEWSGGVDDQVLCNQPQTPLAFQNPHTLAPDGEYGQQVELELPDDQQGPWYVYVIADRSSHCHTRGLVPESDAANNLARSDAFVLNLAPQPDLIVQADSIAWFPHRPASGEPFEVSWDVANVGDAPTDATEWTTEILLSGHTSADVDDDDLVLGSVRRTGSQPLFPDQVERQTVNLRLPHPLSGTEFLKIRTDVTEKVSEAGGEHNNITVSASPIDILLSPSPDLRPGSLIAPDTAFPGHLFSLTWTAENVGAHPKTEERWQDAIYLSSDAAWDEDDIRLGRFAHATSRVADAFEITPYSLTRSFRMNTDVDPGEYFLILVLDDNDDLFEGEAEAEPNTLVSARPIVVLDRAADLEVTHEPDPTCPPPTSAAAGQAISLCWRVTNHGDAPTPVPQWTDRVWFSEDSDLDSEDRRLDSLTHDGILQPGAFYTVHAKATVPWVAPGEYTLLVQVDARDDVFEGSSAIVGNALVIPFVVTPDAADLVARDVIAPKIADADSEIAVSWTVVNTGTLPTTQTRWTDAIYLSRDTVLGRDDRRLGSKVHMGSIAVGAEYAQSGRFSLPRTASGLYHIIVVTDDGDDVFESSEQNNAFPKGMLLDVAALPPSDLKVSTVTAQAETLSGQTLSVQWRVCNDGAGATNSDSWRDVVFLSHDQFFDRETDVFLGSVDHPGYLAPGECYDVSHDFDVSADVGGPFFVHVATNSNGTVSENEEGQPDLPEEDSARAGDLTLISSPPVADLEAVEVSAPESAFLGNEVTIRWTIRNAGTQPVRGRWTDSIYLSSNAEFDVDDVLLARSPTSMSQQYLNPGETLQVGTTISVGELPLGTYHAFVQVDVYDQIPEVDNASNNLAAASTTMTVSAHPLPVGDTVEFEHASGMPAYFVTPPLANGALRVKLQCPSSWRDCSLSARALGVVDNEPPVYSTPTSQSSCVLMLDGPPNTQYLLSAEGSIEERPNSLGVFTLLAELQPTNIESVAPLNVSNDGQTTITIRGNSLAQLTTARLQSSSHTIQAIEVRHPETSVAQAVFQMHQEPVGNFELILDDAADGRSVRAPVRISVAAPSALAVTAEILDTATPRVGVPFQLHARVHNHANRDLSYVNVMVFAAGRKRLDLFALNAQRAAHATVLGGEPRNVMLDGDTVEGSLIRNLHAGDFLDLALTISEFDHEPFNVAIAAVAIEEEEFMSMARDVALAVRDEIQTQAAVYGVEDDVKWMDDPSVWSAFVSEFLRERGVIDSGGAPTSSDETVSASWACPTSACGSCCKGWVQYAVGCVGSLVLLPGGAIACVGGALAGAIMKYWICTWDSDGYCRMKQCMRCGLGLFGACPQGCQVFSPVWPFDPNELSGPDGIGDGRYIRVERSHYVVRFENLASASAPAATVRITDRLDESLNLASFQLGSIQFGETTVSVPENRSHFATRLDLTEDHGVLLEIEAGVDLTTRTAYWEFRSIDPETGTPAVGALAGFLPPNDETHRGEGSVEYSILPRSTIPTGTVIRNKATIFFDANEPIDTNEVFNTIDAEGPDSRLNALPPQVTSRAIDLQWSVEDPNDGSGLAGVTVYARLAGGSYSPVLSDQTERQAVFADARGGGTYDFYSVARDLVGNIEAAPLSPDATTTVALQSPSVPEVIEVTAATITLAGLGDANVDPIEHAVQERQTWLFVGLDGRLSPEPFWQPLRDWDEATMRALSPSTAYSFAAIARDAATLETTLGRALTLETSPPGDVDGDAEVTPDDIGLLREGLGFRFGEASFDPRLDLDGDDLVSERDAEIVIVALGRGDMNDDGLIAREDANLLATCVSGPETIVGDGPCEPGDVDADGDVDLADFARIQKRMERGQ